MSFQILRKNLRILESNKLELLCLAKIAEGTDVWHRTSVVTLEHVYSSEAIAFCKSFLNMYSNIPLPSRDTAPLRSTILLNKIWRNTYWMLVSMPSILCNDVLYTLLPDDYLGPQVKIIHLELKKINIIILILILFLSGALFQWDQVICN